MCLLHCGFQCPDKRASSKQASATPEFDRDLLVPKIHSNPDSDQVEQNYFEGLYLTFCCLFHLYSSFFFLNGDSSCPLTTPHERSQHLLFLARNPCWREDPCRTMTRCLCGIDLDWGPNSLFSTCSGDLTALPSSDCVMAEQLCLSDSTCNATYRTLENCALAKTRLPSLDHDSRVRCLNAELDLGNSSLLHCRCHRRMKRQEHCLRIFWTVHSSMTDGEMK